MSADRLVTLKEAAERCGIHLRTLQNMVERRKLASAVKRPMFDGSARTVWVVPADALGTLGRQVRKRKPRATGRVMHRGAGRCDCCSILLERSGDALHPNDAPTAGRCWMCKEDYGEAVEVLGHIERCKREETRRG